MNSPLNPYCSSAMLLGLGLSTLCYAQTTPSIRSRVTITHIKPDMINEWRALERASIPDLKKGGMKSRTFYQTYPFGSNYENVVVVPIQSFADFDGQPALAKAMEPGAYARHSEMVRKCIESSTSFLTTRLDEISNLVQNDAPPPIVVQARYRIAPGKLQEFISLSKSDLLPVYKKAGVRMTVGTRGTGANPSDVVVSTFYKSFADWDGQPFLTKQLGQEGASKMNAKFVGIRTIIEVTTRRRIDDLSF